MNKKGQISFVFLLVFFLLMIVSFSFIEPLKETLDSSAVRGSEGLNCPGTPTFNSTAFNQQTVFEQLNYRGTCFVTGISMVWLVGAVLIYGAIWVFDNWARINRGRR